MTKEQIQLNYKKKSCLSHRISSNREDPGEYMLLYEKEKWTKRKKEK